MATVEYETGFFAKDSKAATMLDEHIKKLIKQARFDCAREIIESSTNYKPLYTFRKSYQSMFDKCNEIIKEAE